jgi:hypothetical protein
MSVLHKGDLRACKMSAVDRRLLFLSRFVFDLDNLSTLVKAAVWADAVGQHWLVAVAAFT